jgi:hypothetical protein
MESKPPERSTTAFRFMQESINRVRHYSRGKG